MICRIWEVGCVVFIDFSIIWSNVVSRAISLSCGAAPSRGIRVYDHLGVPGYISGDISIARFAIVLPTTTNVNKVKLALGSSPFFDIQSQPHLKIWPLRKLKGNLNCKLLTVSSSVRKCLKHRTGLKYRPMPTLVS